MKRSSGKQGPARKSRVRKGEPGRLEAGIGGDGITVYWETDATHGQRCCAWFHNEAVELNLLACLLDLDPEVPPTWVLGDPFLSEFMGGPKILSIDLEKKPSREEFECVHDRLVEWQRRILQPTESEALDLLAHTNPAVRAYALSHVGNWRQRWRTAGPGAAVARETRRYYER